MQLFLSLLFAININSIACEDCAQPNADIQKINKLVEQVMPGIRPAVEQGSNCTGAEEDYLYAELKRVGLRIESLIDSVNKKYQEIKNKDIHRKLGHVKKVLQCINEKALDKAKIYCGSKVCNNDPYAFMHVNTNYYFYFIKKPIHTIWVCKNNLKRNNIFYQKDYIRGILMHELSHMCLAKDVGYLDTVVNSEEHNRSVGYKQFVKAQVNSVKDWHKNADHYGFWQSRGFCVPNYDCDGSNTTSYED